MRRYGLRVGEVAVVAFVVAGRRRVDSELECTCQVERARRMMEESMQKGIDKLGFECWAVGEREEDFGSCLGDLVFD